MISPTAATAAPGTEIVAAGPTCTLAATRCAPAGPGWQSMLKICCPLISPTKHNPRVTALFIRRVFLLFVNPSSVLTSLMYVHCYAKNEELALIEMHILAGLRRL